MKAISGLMLAAAAAAFVFESARGGYPATAAFAAALAALGRLSAGGPGPLWTRAPASGVFLFCLAAYLSTFRWHGGDDLPNSLVPLALLRHGTPALDLFYDAWFAHLPSPDDFLVRTGGALLSIYPIAPGVLALPVFLVPALAAPEMSVEFLHQLSKVSGALVTAASAAALYQACSARASREWALLTSLLYGLGSWAFSVCGQAIWQHGPATLGVALTLWGFSREGRRFDLLAGFGLGLAVASRPDHVFVLAAGLAFVLWKRRDRLAGVVLGGALPAALLAWYWLAFTGRLSPPELAMQSSVFGTFDPWALAGLVASPHRGILFFFPVAPFALWAAWRRRGDGLTPLLVAGFAAQVVFFCYYDNWVGGRSFGSRYFSGFAAALCWFLAGAEDDVRARPRLLTAFLAAAAACLVVHLVGGYFNWPGSWVIADTIARVWHWNSHPLVFVFSPGGGLGGLPAPLKAVIAAAVLATAAAGSRFLTRRFAR